MSIGKIVKTLVFSLTLLAVSPLKPLAYMVKYKEDYYKLYHVHYQQFPDDCLENIYWLEQAVKSDFCNPLYAYTKIENESAIRAEYKAVMVKVAKESCEAEGVEFDDETRAYAEEMADEVIDAITEETYATYEIQGNKFVYTIDGYSINETFTLNGKNIVLTGSSIGNEGYPITLVKL